MADYFPPEPASAERVDKQRLAEKALCHRLRGASTEQLKRLARDVNEPREARSSALSTLVQSSLPSTARPEDPELADILIGLLAEPDPEMRRQALPLSRHFWLNSRVVETVRRLLDDPNPQVQAAAAAAHSTKKTSTQTTSTP